MPRVAKPLPLLGSGSSAEAGGGSGSAAPRGPTGCCCCRKRQRQSCHVTARQQRRIETVSSELARPRWLRPTTSGARDPQAAGTDQKSNDSKATRRGERGARRQLRFRFAPFESAPPFWLYALLSRVVSTPSPTSDPMWFRRGEEASARPGFWIWIY